MGILFVFAGMRRASMLTTDDPGWLPGGARPSCVLRSTLAHHRFSAEFGSVIPGRRAKSQSHFWSGIRRGRVLKWRMPTLSEFFGILIRMYWDDHPPPHFHAIYGEHEAQYNIATLDVIHGTLPRRAHAMVVEWASLHRDELMKNWERCQVPAPTVPIQPLE